MEGQIIHRFIDDEAEPDEYALLKEAPVQMEAGFAKIIVVDGLPVIPMEKYEKLMDGVVKKIYSQIGEIVQVYMPEEDGQTKGFAFIEFTSAIAAQNAVKQTNGYKLDKSHIFKVNLYDDYVLYEKVAEEFKPTEMPIHKAKENLLWWLLETERAKEQMVARYSDMTEIFWHDGHKRNPESIYKKSEMTETFVTWSPFGTYLGTFHRQGIILWGGPGWEKIMRFTHNGVKLLDFSPRENYMVTIAPQLVATDNPKDPQAVIVWDVLSGAKMRGFIGSKEGTSWPIFKWSHDEKYFARLGPDTISIYETPSMALLDKKSLKITGVQDFNWSPTDHIIACWVPESGNKPARVMLIEVPSRKITRSHNLFKVKECSLNWQSNGDYLCVKVDRKAGKSATYTSFELYRMRQKQIPIEALEIKENVIAFAWEPKGDRFAIIHSNTNVKHSVSFYSMVTKKEPNHYSLLKTLPKRQANNLYWSPKGGVVVLAGIGGQMGGTLEFVNAEEIETMRIDAHMLVTDVVWDHSGRFVATYTSYWRHQLDNGFAVWTFQGKMLYRVSKEKFYQLLWRPRPPSLLSEEKQAEIKKNLRQYASKYKKQDFERKKAAWEAFMEKREKERAAFNDMRAKRLGDRRGEKGQRVSNRRGIDSDDENFEEVEEMVEEIVGEPEVEIIE